jgi:hypothetical protein
MHRIQKLALATYKKVEAARRFTFNKKRRWHIWALYQLMTTEMLE